MGEMAGPDAALVARVEKLEATLLVSRRHGRALLLVGLAVMLAFAVAIMSTHDRVDLAMRLANKPAAAPQAFSIAPSKISSGELDLRDESRRAILTANTVASSLYLIGDSDSSMYALAISGTSTALMRGKGGTLRFGVNEDGPFLEMSDDKMNRRMVLGVAHLAYQGTGETVTTPPTLVLFDSKGNVTFKAPTGK